MHQRQSAAVVSYACLYCTHNFSLKQVPKYLPSSLGVQFLFWNALFTCLMHLCLCRASPPLGQPQLMSLFRSLPELPSTGHLPITLLETVRLYTPWVIALAKETPEEGLPLLDLFSHLLDTGKLVLTRMFMDCQSCSLACDSKALLSKGDPSSIGPARASLLSCHAAVSCPTSAYGAVTSNIPLSAWPVSNCTALSKLQRAHVTWYVCGAGDVKRAESQSELGSEATSDWDSDSHREASSDCDEDDTASQAEPAEQVTI